VTLREVPGRKVAAVRFSGFVGEDKVAAKTAELRDWVVARGLSIAGAAQLARYDAPWTPPFLRRNEILIEVK
jgi:DNA gyrase inhibitor GyrI